MRIRAIEYLRDKPEMELFDRMAGFAAQEVSRAVEAERMECAKIAHEFIECQDHGCESCTIAKMTERAIRARANGGKK
jgi:hypothetical protein